MGFDAFGFQDIRIDGTLSQEFYVFELFGFFRKDIDEDLADDLAFGLRIGYAFEFFQEYV